MTPGEPQSANDYEERTTAAVKAVLIEIGQILGSYKGKFAVVGGAVPWLLLENEDMHHVGTLDIDLGLDAEALGDGEYADLVGSLMGHGYQQRDALRRFQLVRQIESIDGGAPIDVIVDFLMPKDAVIVKNKPPLIDDFAVQRASGAELALQFNELVAISGTMPGGGTNTVEIAVCSIPALLAMKGHAIEGRLKQKDAYDIYYCVRNYPDGVEALAAACRPLLDHKAGLAGYQFIAGKFESLDGFGPTCVRKFVEESQVLDDRSPDQWQQDGPGMGKSTLLKKLALDYSADGFLTLFVRLPQVVALLAREGRRFEESLMEVALSGSGLRAPLVSLEGAVILCDALDECGSQQPLVTASLHAFSVAHPSTRIVVTSRPIGYRPGELAGWRHYELQPLDDTAAEKAVTKVLEAIPFADAALRSRAVEQAIAQLNVKATKGAAARSPLMITLVAALAVKGMDPGLGKGALYRKLFQLLQDHPPARLTERPPNEPERNRFLEMLGWCLLSHGNEPAEQTLSRCARWWSDETGQSFFVSETKISECLGYWECLGVVERVRTHTQEAITFVHKTFGEFAAARYMSKCAPRAQREIVARAIGTPDWKEALSFASHLGLTSQILQVWAELAEGGDIKAGSMLDNAVELVVQAGMPLTSEALGSFVQCCWRAVEKTASRVRYAAGEALCLVSQDHWSVVKEEALARLESPDGWIRLVAWACLSVSPDQGLPIQRLTEALPGLRDSQPTDSYLGGFHLGPTAKVVWRHLVRGAAQRILAVPPTAKTLQVLRELLGDANDLSLNTIGELGPLFKQAGLELSEFLGETWSHNMARYMPDRESWNRDAAYVLELIDDPLVASDEADSVDSGHSFELGACMTAISYWEMSVGDKPSATASDSADAARRLVIRALARGAGLDHVQLVRQARAMKRKILHDVKNEAFGFLDLPKVDAKAELDHPLVEKQFMSVLEDVLVGPCHLFALNAAYLLYSMNQDPEYSGAVKRVLTRGRGESLRLSAALANQLPDETRQQFILDRLCQGESTPGCRHLYLSLTAPYGARHLEAVRKGLSGNSADAAKAAAELAKELPTDGAWAQELRTFFEEWRAKEEPYPRGDGLVPESPRGELAKVLATAFAQDHAFLLTLLADLRPDVQSAARESFLAEAAGSVLLRSKLLEAVLTGGLQPDLLRAAVSKGLYLGDEAIGVARLLHSEDARLRYAALPILDVKYLQPDQVRDESNRLLSDKELDIREGASRALHGLESLSC